MHPGLQIISQYSIIHYTMCHLFDERLMIMPMFPRTQVAGISLPRMLIGTNWVLGYSHTTSSADKMITRRFGSREAVSELLEAYLEYGIDAVMGPGEAVLTDGIKMAEDRTGKSITYIYTPIMNLGDSAAARREAEAVVEEGERVGAKFCLIHHSSVEQLVSKLHGTMDRLPDYTDMIRQHGMIPGLSAHMPELIVYADENGYDVETYIQIYNCMGFLMQIEVEGVHRIIWNAKKPVMTIKSMAAGRCSPFVGLTFSWNSIRPRDMIAVGCMTPEEVHEVVEYSHAAMERRLPELKGRKHQY